MSPLFLKMGIKMVYGHRRTGRGVRGGSVAPPNSGSLSTFIRAESRHYQARSKQIVIGPAITKLSACDLVRGELCSVAQGTTPAPKCILFSKTV